MRVLLLAAMMALGLAACATPYGTTGLTGGFEEKELEPNIWRVGYYGNGFTTPETVQTYWLYRAAELTLEKDFQGFELVSNITLVNRIDAKETRVASGSVYVPIIIPMDSAPKPFLEADIRLLKAPINPKPGKVFDAAALKAQLEGLVKGKKCDAGNVCPHVHHYLYPPQDAAPAPPPGPEQSPSAPTQPPSPPPPAAPAPKPQA